MEVDRLVLGVVDMIGVPLEAGSVWTVGWVKGFAILIEDILVGYVGEEGEDELVGHGTTKYILTQTSLQICATLPKLLFEHLPAHYPQTHVTY